MSSESELYMDDIKNMIVDKLDKIYTKNEWTLDLGGQPDLNHHREFPDKMIFEVVDLNNGEQIGKLIVKNEFTTRRNNEEFLEVEARPKEIYLEKENLPFDLRDFRILTVDSKGNTEWSKFLHYFDKVDLKEEVDEYDYIDIIMANSQYHLDMCDLNIMILGKVSSSKSYKGRVYINIIRHKDNKKFNLMEFTDALYKFVGIKLNLLTQDLIYKQD